MSRSELEREVARLGPWMYEFELEHNVVTPLIAPHLRPVHEVRKDMLMSYLDSTGGVAGASVLDLGCNEGWFSHELLRRGAREVTAIDGRASNIDRARWVAEQVGEERIAFEVADVFSWEPGDRTWDVVLLLGLIYHVADPIGLVHRAARWARRVVILETQLCRTPGSIDFGWGSPSDVRSSEAYFVLYTENEDDNPLASIQSQSLIPNLRAAIETMRGADFSSVVQLHPSGAVREPQYERLDRVMIAGRK